MFPTRSTQRLAPKGRLLGFSGSACLVAVIAHDFCAFFRLPRTVITALNLKSPPRPLMLLGQPAVRRLPKDSSRRLYFGARVTLFSQPAALFSIDFGRVWGFGNLARLQTLDILLWLSECSRRPRLPDFGPFFALSARFLVDQGSVDSMYMWQARLHLRLLPEVAAVSHLVHGHCRVCMAYCRPSDAHVWCRWSFGSRQCSVRQVVTNRQSSYGKTTANRLLAPLHLAFRQSQKKPKNPLSRVSSIVLPPSTT
ncbi:hypothetical protein JVT61DRAFT_985 [Boletus reticuloceps]|uniref:Uncharacterized protein n=1 Tax=Boletus reticuloceps TaxID=495285 RepID=A0A8I3A9L5_9AGAM|nr:hypothetical protein JVT61DRAFT_985 [Boletus reticuloceps]